MQFNTAIARMMELVNALYQTDETELESEAGRQVLSEAFHLLVPMLSPFVPHIADELWEALGNKESLAEKPWPSFIEELTTRDEIEIVFQVNGKIRAKVQVSSDTSREDLEKMAMENERVKENTDAKTIVKVIVVPGKLVNIVVK
jgi:leucyl-tRNA synthetase